MRLLPGLVALKLSERSPATLDGRQVACVVPATLSARLTHTKSGVKPTPVMDRLSTPSPAELPAPTCGPPAGPRRHRHPVVGGTGAVHSEVRADREPIAIERLHQIGLQRRHLRRHLGGVACHGARTHYDRVGVVRPDEDQVGLEAQAGYLAVIQSVPNVAPGTQTHTRG